MQVSMLRSKLHHARITDANIEYVGSITLDMDIVDQVNMLPYEKVLVVDVENASRFETYIIPGERGTGIVQVNGAAAHLVNIGDRIIVMAFASVDYPPTPNWTPQVVVLNEKNQIASIGSTGVYS